jgi:hypothetical protein
VWRDATQITRKRRFASREMGSRSAITEDRSENFCEYWHARCKTTGYRKERHQMKNMFIRALTLGLVVAFPAAVLAGPKQEAAPKAEKTEKTTKKTEKAPAGEKTEKTEKKAPEGAAGGEKKETKSTTKKSKKEKAGEAAPANP